MKYVRIKDLGQGWETKALMTQALSDARQAGGADFDEVERRTRIIRELRSLPSDASVMALEDQDHKTLAAIVLRYKWAVVSPELYEILGDIKDALDKLPVSVGSGAMANGHDAGEARA